MQPIQARNASPPPYKSPTPKNRLFYLFLTIGVASVVYKTAPKSIKGIATLCVGAFGLYRPLGCNWQCIKDTAAKFFGGFGGPSSGRLRTPQYSSNRDISYWQRWGSPWSDQHQPSSSRFRSDETFTGVVNNEKRQGKRRPNRDDEPFSNYSHQQDAFPASTDGGQASGTVLASEGRQGKRRPDRKGEPLPSYNPQQDFSPDLNDEDQVSDTALTGAVSAGEGQEKRKKGANDNW